LLLECSSTKRSIELSSSKLVPTSSEESGFVQTAKRGGPFGGTAVTYDPYEEGDEEDCEVSS
jgi:hypothetical protein